MQHNIIDKILKEATLEKDLDRSKQASTIMGKIGQRLKSYNGENISNELEYSDEFKIFFTKIGDLSVYIFGYDSPHPVAKHAKSVNREAAYAFKDKTLYVFNATLSFDEKTKHLQFDINPQTLYHELIHYLDYSKVNLDKYHSHDAAAHEKGDSKYLNDPFELNAHFHDKIVPEIEHLISQGKQVVEAIKERGWNFFRQTIFNLPNVSNYFKGLNKQNQKRFLKRLAEYFQKIVKMNE